MNSLIIDEIFSNFHKANPTPKTELNYTNLFTLLVAVILSAQTTDAGVNKATKALFKVARDVETMAALGEDGIKKYISTVGLYNSKARNIMKLCDLLMKKHNGEVPLTFEALVALPGVGRKTANVVLNCWLKIPTMPVDTHVFRVSKRIGLAKGSSPEKVEFELLKVIPNRWLINAHHHLVLHGRYVCKARKPDCARCIISEYCEYYKERSTKE